MRNNFLGSPYLTDIFTIHFPINIFFSFRSLNGRKLILIISSNLTYIIIKLKKINKFTIFLIFKWLNILYYIIY